MICDYCGKEFMPTHYKQKYCSKECYRQNYLVDKVEKECIVCGMKFVAERTTTQTCSSRCSRKMSRRKKAAKRPPKEMIKCGFCGKEFVPDKQRKYCSLACKIRMNNKKRSRSGDGLHTKECKVCGKIFEASNIKKIYCSHTCAKQQYNKTHRDKVLSNRAKATCKYCGESFFPRRIKGTVSEYCSRACKKAASKKDYIGAQLTRAEVEAVVFAQDFAPKGKLWELSQGWSKKQRDYAKRRYCHIHGINGHPGDY